MIHYFLYETRPIPGSEINAGIGGAYVNCWIQADTEIEAAEEAEQVIKDNELIITRVLEAYSVTREFYRDNEEAQAHFDEAVREGLCVLIHEWAIDAEDDDVDYDEEEDE
jgi:hypothetical protein